MRHFGLPRRTLPHTPIPRGIARSGPVLLSYGFRPFFLLAGLYAPLAMTLWIGALLGWWSVGGSEGPIGWHAHEMLFGYAAAALAGFVLTAIPNWTGRLPVSGRPLAALLVLWIAGRAVNLAPGMLGELASAAIDALFLPMLAFAVAREVIAGRNWQNLRVAAGVSTLAALNIAFHVMVFVGGDIDVILRGTVALYAMLICLVGGRIVPSFTRNYLARRGETRLPAPMDKLDHVALASSLLAGISWTALPDSWITAALCAAAGGLHAVRLARWRGQTTWREPLLLVLHTGYAFVALGYLAIALSSIGLVSAPSALHLLTVGAIGTTTLAVMTRASRGHTGRPLTASPITTASYVCLVAAALLRPLAEHAADYYHPILAASSLCWIAAYVLFVAEHAPMLGRAAPSPAASASKRAPDGSSRA